MCELMDTTEKYVEDAVDLLGLLYQENQQNEISTLQMIFLIGTVGNIFVLGTLTNFTLYNMVVFGGFSILISLAVYWVWHSIFKRSRLHRAISLLEKTNHEEEI